MRPYYEDGRAGIVLYCGDCRDMLPLLGLSRVLVVTDPPYGIDYKPGGNGIAERRVHERVTGDTEPFDPAHLLNRGRAIFWGANHYADRLPASPSWLVWDKRKGTTSDCHADCEMAWSNLGGPARIYSQLWRGMLREGEPDARTHPTQKPLWLMEWCLLQAAGDEVVLDPYCGSGTTLKAAKQLGRACVGIEIEERYCEIAANRLAQEVMNFA